MFLQHVVVAQSTEAMQRIYIADAEQLQREVNFFCLCCGCHYVLCGELCGLPMLSLHILGSEFTLQDTERHELMSELVALDDHLKAKLSEHEQQFNYRFVWKGSALLDVLVSSSMPSIRCLCL